MPKKMPARQPGAVPVRCRHCDEIGLPVRQREWTAGGAIVALFTFPISALIGFRHFKGWRRYVCGNCGLRLD